MFKSPNPRKVRIRQISCAILFAIFAWLTTPSYWIENLCRDIFTGWLPSWFAAVLVGVASGLAGCHIWKSLAQLPHIRRMELRGTPFEEVETINGIVLILYGITGYVAAAMLVHSRQFLTTNQFIVYLAAVMFTWGAGIVAGPLSQESFGDTRKILTD